MALHKYSGDGLVMETTAASNQSVSTRVLDQWTVLDVDMVHIDYRNCEELKQMISHLLADNRTQLLMNMKNVSFMDSAGLGVILYGKRSCDAKGGRFSVCNVNGYVTNLFRLTNLERAVKIFPTEEAALACLPK